MRAGMDTTGMDTVPGARIMNNKYSLALTFVACAFIFFAARPAFAQARTYEIGMEAGVSATDNIGRTPDTMIDPATDEAIYTAGMNFKLRNDARRWDIDLIGSVRRNMYENQTFEDETLSTLWGVASLYLIKNRLDWAFNVNHGQQLLNPFEPVRPDNRENVTVLSTGPRFYIPVGTRTYVTGGGTYSDIAYEFRPFDNERLAGRLGLRRDISPTKSVSLNIDADRIEYDLSFISPPIDRQNVYLGYTINDSRNDLSLKIGWNQIERAGKEGDGLLLEMDWSREVSQLSKITVNLGSKYSTDGDIFRLNQRLENNRSLTQDVQNVDDPFRYDYIRLSYAYSAARTTVTIGVHFDSEKYENLTSLDREISGFELSIRREFSRSFNGSLFGRISNRDYGNAGRSDDDASFGVAFGWDFSKKMSLELRLERNDRTVEDSIGSYDENRASLTIHYVPIRSR